MQSALEEIVQDKGKNNFYLFLLVIVTNIGTTTVTYEWKKVHRKDLIPSTNSDLIQRFYCHYVSHYILICYSHEAFLNQVSRNPSSFRLNQTRLACLTKNGNC